MNYKRSMARKVLPKRNALVTALALSLSFSGLAFGQATTGTIFGSAPQQAGETVVVKSATGLTREVSVNSNGQYTISHLPAGSYTVTLREDGDVVGRHNNVGITVGAGTQVNFLGGSPASNAQELGVVSVTANAMPKIDVTTSTPSMVLDASELSKIPVGQSAESIALLAPGVVGGSGFFGNAVSFLGAGVTENAYYVNGFNTTNMYNYTGSAYQLPYGAIGQQQVLTGGYGAKYGRSDGGVISQVGKRGTNEWHFGARIQWIPRVTRADPRNKYYKDIKLYGDEEFANTKVGAGDLYRYRNENKGWETKYGAYVGGPLIEDTLFFFVAAEKQQSSYKNVSTVSAKQVSFNRSHTMKWYGKIDWNINENNLLEYTILKQQSRDGYGEVYKFDNEKRVATDFIGHQPWQNRDYDARIWHFTSYLSDKATLSILYGHAEVEDPQVVPNVSSLPLISGRSSIDPGIPGGRDFTSPQTAGSILSPDRKETSRALRVDFTYVLGNHSLSAGIDNIYYSADNVGQRYSGPGYVWIYSHGEPDDYINNALGVGKPGGNGYYVSKQIYTTVTSMSAEQKGWYIQDDWSVTPNFLLSIGLRNDSFKNFNPDGVAFVSQENQWEPRVGFSWDVNGDASFKVYGHVGRYYLALPQAAAKRSATSSTFTTEYFTYTGVDDNGVPTGLSPVPNVAGTGPAGPVSANGEFGELPNPKYVASTDLEAQYQDEYILGFDHTLGSKWVYGAKAVYRQLGRMIDDGCYPTALKNSLVNEGYNPSDYAWSDLSCHSFNPGDDNSYLIPAKDGSGEVTVTVPFSATGLPKPQREYYALNLYLQHPFDGTWMGRVDYTFSRSWGNAEGQVRSDIGQTDVSLTEDWDYAALMSGARGYLANDRRHQIKAFGAWQFAQDWMLSGLFRVVSGGPVTCLGFYGPTPTDSTTRNPGLGYGSDYHWCEGEIWTPGQERTSWYKQLNLGITYRPSFADHKLAFKLYVYNVTDSQEALQLRAHRFERHARTVRNDYRTALFTQTPRYMRFTITYDY